MRRLKRAFELDDEQNMILPSDELESRQAIRKKLKARFLYKKRREELKKSGIHLVVDDPEEKSWWSTVGDKVRKAWKRARRMCGTLPPKKVYDLEVSDAQMAKSVIVDLIYSLLSFGMPVYRVENHCQQICQCYGVNCYLDATHTGFLITFAKSYDEDYTDTRYVKIANTSVNLNKLCLLDDVAHDIISNRIAIRDAKQRIKDIISSPPLYANTLFPIFSYALSSTCYSIYVFSLWHQIIAMFITGVIVGTVIVFIRKFLPSLNTVSPAIASLISGLSALAFQAIYAKYDMPLVFLNTALGGIVPSLPGLSITTAIQELTSRQVRSGAIRLISAATVSIQLALGIYIAKMIQTASKVPHIPAQTYDFPKWALALVIPCNGVGYMVSLKAPQDPLTGLFVIANSYQGYFITQKMSALLTPELGALIAAFCLQTVSKIYGWLSNRPPAVITSCAILLLVPGSVSVKSVDALLNNDWDNGSALLIRTGQIALGLAFGLILSNFTFAWIGHRHDQVIKIHRIKKVKQRIGVVTKSART